MNAQEMLLDYAAKHNDGKIYTNEQFIGKAITEGICINRSAGIRTNARVRREGKTIIVTETTITPTVTGNREETVEIFRVNV